MKCPTCGADVQPGQKYCPSCGTQQKTDRPWGNPSAPSIAVEDQDITKSEFCRSRASDKVRKNIRGSAILCYISAGVTAVFAVLFNLFMLIDAVIVLGLGLAIYLSRVCSILLLVYGVVSCVTVLMETGRVSGWLVILAGVFAVIYTFQLEKEYRAFRGN